MAIQFIFTYDPPWLLGPFEYPVLLLPVCIHQPATWDVRYRASAILALLIRESYSSLYIQIRFRVDSSTR